MVLRNHFERRFLSVLRIVREEATGATVLHRKAETLENWEAVVLADYFADSSTEQVSAILGQVHNLELQNGELRSQARDLLLPRLMNGEIAV